jgi:hypothetical protein
MPWFIIIVAVILLGAAIPYGVSRQSDCDKAGGTIIKGYCIDNKVIIRNY